MTEAMRWISRAILAIALFAVPVLAQVRVVGSLEGAPAGGWTLDVNDARQELDAPEFDVTAEDAAHYSIRIEAPGCYPSLHAFARSDVRDGVLRIPPIHLLHKAPGRRLLVFGGDAMLGRRYLKPLSGEPVLARAETLEDDAKNVLRWVKPYLEIADVASVNLETQVFDEPPESETPKSVTFYTRPQLLGALAWAGVDYVALGNNHTFDFGQAGLEKTLEHLRASSLAFSGAGLDEASARRPITVTAGGEPIVYHSYVGWKGTFHPHQAAEGDKGGAALGTLGAIGADLAGADDTPRVFQFHSGFEYADGPSLRVETALKTAIDLGADVAIGHHPHVLQGLDLYRDKLVAYSLGNFLFDQYIYGTQFGMLLFVCMDGETFVEAQAVPIYLQGYVPTPATGLQRDAVIRRLATLTNTNTGRLALTASGAHLRITPWDLEGGLLAEISIDFGDDGVADVRAAVPAHRRVVAVLDGPRVRLGTDVWNRGDFENFGLYDSPERGWLEGEGVSIESEGNAHRLKATTGAERTARIGMRTFMRQFTMSADVTLRFRARATAPVTVEFFVQRRRDGDGLSEALESGPREHAGTLHIDSSDWRPQEVDFSWPRLPTLGVRVVAEVRSNTDATLLVDDWELIEWRTAPIEPGVPLDHPAAYTHAQRIDRAGGDREGVTLVVTSGDKWQ